MAGQTLQKRFGQQIRAMRQARDLTQQALASQSGLSVDAIRRIERGALSPSLETVHKLATGLRVSLPTLFDGLQREHRDEVAELRDLLILLDARQLQTAQRVLQAIFP